MTTESDTHEVIYGCETKDGGTGFEEGRIVCESDIDAQAVFLAIQEHPERFDFAPIDEGQKRLVRYDHPQRPAGYGGTAYLD